MTQEVVTIVPRFTKDHGGIIVGVITRILTYLLERCIGMVQY